MRDHLGKLGGGLMTLGAGGALAYLITSHAVGQPSAPLTWPVWPYYLCGAMFAVGAVVYGAVHGMLPWQTHRALRRRAETAESALEDARRERDEARRAAEDVQRVAISAPGEPKPPPFRLRHHTRKSSLAGTPAASHFVAVTNPAGQPERWVHVTAESMSPYPRRRQAFGIDPAFPHAVPPEGADTPPPAGRVIAPGQEQSWAIGTTWTRPDGKISVCEFFSDTGADWELGPDERWRISYRITCDGVPGVPFSIVIAAEEGEAVVRLEG